ncbi:MAG: nucleotidyltransferase [Chrysothrix sp. TS-e1954]|nr:MAG: nucleotidyltransferase [Chrysothrix sp. TS-e1954]
MTPTPCESCHTSRALILRPKTRSKLCSACFLSAFESEIHTTITTTSLFRPGETIAIGASGGKDSTVLASVLKTLNARHAYGLNLVLLSIDEGITGYRDDSLETVKRNAAQYDLPLTILGYKELYGWTMDEVVAQVGKRGNCTYCGVFRRQALDRGAARLGIKHVVTGHNADDVAETVLMNLLRGDLPRLARATKLVTESSGSEIKRSKPLMYAYEKEIVMYAHHKRLDYFSTECIYSPEAFRGSARALVKDLERVRPESILDLVRSGEDMAAMVPEELLGGGTGKVGAKAAAAVEDEEGETGCGSANGRSSGGEMASMEQQLREKNQGAEEREVEITSATVSPINANGQRHDRHTSATTSPLNGQRHDRDPTTALPLNDSNSPNPNAPSKTTSKNQGASRKVPQGQMGKCERCGYLSSQKICKACMLLEGLNRNRPKSAVEVEVEPVHLTGRVGSLAVGDANG